jgi:hypothetical protein
VTSTSTSASATFRHTRDRRRLIAYLATKFGVRVIEQEAAEAWRTLFDERPASWSEAPFTSHLGVVWDKFEIHATTETPWPHLLHEAGHLVATTERPDAAKEFTFLGWEMAVVEHLGLSMKAFHASNAEYGVTFGQYYEMGALKFGSKDWWKFVGACQETARDAKLLRPFDNEPLSLRSNVLR